MSLRVLLFNLLRVKLCAFRADIVVVKSPGSKAAVADGRRGRDIDVVIVVIMSDAAKRRLILEK